MMLFIPSFVLPFWAFNFTVDWVTLFWAFDLSDFPQQTDLNQLMTQAVSWRLESIRVMSQVAFQELTQNHLVTQVDSQVLIQIDS